MISSKLIALACLATFCISVTLAAIPGGANTYLPPNKGYDYSKPTVSFPTPPPPPRPPVRPPTGPPARPPPGPPPVRPPPGPSPPGHEEHHHHEPGMPFDFEYSVNDIETANDYSHKAVSDGDVTRGEYRVQLPDGRTQIVRYTADWRNGFNAEVTYEGEARYPEGPFPSGGGGGRGPSQGGYKY